MDYSPYLAQQNKHKSASVKRKEGINRGQTKLRGLSMRPEGKLISTLRKLHLIEILIHPALGQQGIVTAVLHNPAVLNDDNPVGVSDG